MLHDMPRSLWQWWSAVRCWLFDGYYFQLGGGGGAQSNEVCQMWSGCSGSLQYTTSCSEEPQRNMWLLNWDIITFVQMFLKMKFGGRLCSCWALSVLGCVGAGALVMWKLTFDIVRNWRSRNLGLITGGGRDILFSVSRPPTGAYQAVCSVDSRHLTSV